MEGLPRRGLTVDYLHSVRTIAEYAIDRRLAAIKGGSNRACRLAAGVHTLRESGFGSVQRFRTTDRLPACTSRVTGG
jgi:hypothetical protein